MYVDFQENFGKSIKMSFTLRLFVNIFGYTVVTYLSAIGVIVTNLALMILHFDKIDSSGFNNPLLNAAKPVWPSYVVSVKCQNNVYCRKASKSSWVFLDDFSKMFVFEFISNLILNHCVTSNWVRGSIKVKLWLQLFSYKIRSLTLNTAFALPNTVMKKMWTAK